MIATTVLRPLLSERGRRRQHRRAPARVPAPRRHCLNPACILVHGRIQHRHFPVLSSSFCIIIRTISYLLWKSISGYTCPSCPPASMRHHSRPCIEKARTAARLGLRRSLGAMYPSRGSYSARGGLPSASSSSAATSARPAGRFGARTDENRVPAYMRPTTASAARSPADVLMKDAPVSSTAGRVRSAPSSTPGSASSARLGLREHAPNGTTSWCQCVILRSRR